MKIRTKLGAARIWFAYEKYEDSDYEGQYVYGTFNALSRNSRSSDWRLVGYAYNAYYDCNELISDRRLTERPSISDIKNFIKTCYKVIEN